MPKIELTEEQVALFSDIAYMIEQQKKDPPKHDWRPKDVANWVFRDYSLSTCDARRILVARKTAELVCEAIMRQLEKDRRLYRENSDTWAMYTQFINLIRHRKNDDLRRLSDDS